jgi:hypothetical protein
MSANIAADGNKNTIENSDKKTPEKAPEKTLINEENRKESGRPNGTRTKYHKKYCKEIIQYFDVKIMFIKELSKIKHNRDGTTQEEYQNVPCDLPMFEGFAKKIGVTTKTLNNWRDKYPKFREAYEKAHDIQKHVLTNHCLKGHYNPIFGKIAAINLMSWKDGSRDLTSTIKRDVQSIPDKDLTSEIDKRLKNITPFRKAVNQ